jgi:ATP-binding cassette, subfamily B (MDR/TAP), member 1
MDKTGWKHLFAFMTAKHLVFLLPAAICSLAGGAVFPVNAYLIGKLFSKFTAYGSGELDVSDFKEQVIKYVLYTLIVGGLGWLFNSLAFLMWHIFAGLQGRCARQLVYNAMLLGPVEWFDRRKDGVKALSIRIQS